jgi:hypothetical protein
MRPASMRRHAAAPGDAAPASQCRGMMRLTGCFCPGEQGPGELEAAPRFRQQEIVQRAALNLLHKPVAAAG